MGTPMPHLGGGKVAMCPTYRRWRHVDIACDTFRTEVNICVSDILSVWIERIAIINQSIVDHPP